MQFNFIHVYVYRVNLSLSVKCSVMQEYLILIKKDFIEHMNMMPNEVLERFDGYPVQKCFVSIGFLQFNCQYNNKPHLIMLYAYAILIRIDNNFAIKRKFPTKQYIRIIIASV